MLDTENKAVSQGSVPKTTDEKIEDAFIDDVIQKFPVEDRHEVRKMMSLSMEMNKVMSASPEMELMKKMTSENIETFLEGQKEAMGYQFKEGRENKIFLCIIVLIFLIFIVILVNLLKDKPDILEKVLYTMGGVIVGGFGGYGVGKTKKDE